MKFSVIIPTFNEGSQIAASLRRLREISKTSPMEVILVDGNSDDNTVGMARDYVDEMIVMDKPNRGAQLHAGAQRAAGDLLLFLHADAQPPGTWQQALEHFWLSPHKGRAAATVFTVDFGSSLGFRLASAASNWSARWRNQPTGEHGFCTTPEIYRESGGFPPYPIMEDVAFAQKIKNLGSVAVLKERIWPAARRMHSVGPLTCMLENSWRRLRYGLGANPEDLLA